MQAAAQLGAGIGRQDDKAVLLVGTGQTQFEFELAFGQPQGGHAGFQLLQKSAHQMPHLVGGQHLQLARADQLGGQSRDARRAQAQALRDGPGGRLLLGNRGLHGCGYGGFLALGAGLQAFEQGLVVGQGRVALLGQALVFGQ